MAKQSKAPQMKTTLIPITSLVRGWTNPKFHWTLQDVFLFPMGQQAGNSIWITQSRIQMPARGNKPCGHSAKLVEKHRFQTTSIRGFPNDNVGNNTQMHLGVSDSIIIYHINPCSPSLLWPCDVSFMFWQTLSATVGRGEYAISNLELTYTTWANFLLGEDKTEQWEGENVFGQLSATWQTAWNPMRG